MKKILTLAAALMLCGSLYAQIDPTVEVSRQYKVNIADIDRPLTSDHSVADSLQRFDVDFDYSIFNRPYTDLYEFTPYQTDSISKVERRRPPYVMAQFGAQFPFVADLQLKSQLFARPRFNVGVDLDGKASAADLDYLGEDDALNAVRIGGGVSANVKRAWKTGELTPCWATTLVCTEISIMVPNWTTSTTTLLLTYPWVPPTPRRTACSTIWISTI